MSGHLGDAYWSEEFDITAADLERIAGSTRANRQACSLDDLAGRVVHDRLRHGPDESPGALPPGVVEPGVRLWDATGDWHPGDRVIVVHLTGEGLGVFLAEIVAVGREQARLRLDRTGEERLYQRKPHGSKDANRWRARLQKEVEEKMIAPDLAERSRAVLARHGERIIGRLLAALRADTRFVELDKRWLLRELLRSPSAAQMTALFRQLLGRTTPATPAELASLVRPPLPPGDVGLFSLHQALLAAPRRFRSVGSVSRTLWEAIPPTLVPPDRAVATYYAYDPTTWEILVRPGQRPTPRLAQRLQELELYDDVVSAADETAL